MYKDINDIFAEARKGNTNKKEELLINLRPLVLSSIKRYYFKREEFDDLVQEGNLLILECIDSFDDSKGVYFLGYVKTMLRFLYLNKHKERLHLSLNTPVGEDLEGELMDLLEDPDDSALDGILKNEERDSLINALNELSPRQKEIIMANYLEGHSLDYIAGSLGITYRTVANTKTRALDRLRRILKGF